MQWFSANGNVELRSGLNSVGPPPSRRGGRLYPSFLRGGAVSQGNVAKLGGPSISSDQKIARRRNTQHKNIAQLVRV